MVMVIFVRLAGHGRVLLSLAPPVGGTGGGCRTSSLQDVDFL